jgi:hypothetical protein
MDVVIDIGLGLGLLPQQIDEMTPDEVFKIQNSKEQEFKRQRHLVSYGAWLSEALHRTKKLPSLSEVLEDKEQTRKRQQRPKAKSFDGLKKSFKQAEAKIRGE